MSISDSLCCVINGDEERVEQEPSREADCEGEGRAGQADGLLFAPRANVCVCHLKSGATARRSGEVARGQTSREVT